jgi:putative CocE/NonD family hydrolase
VRLFVGGVKRWCEFDSWPPPARATRWHLQPDGKLDPAPAPDSQPDSYVFDPAKPTPSLGGASLSMHPAVVDNRTLEARADVLSFTSAPLVGDLEVIGEVSAELWVSSSAECSDFFVRVCDVDPSGVSRNVCDGLTRVRFAGAPASVQFVLWPTAYRFARGHRLRVQVASGAYPRWAANPGTGAALTSTSPGVRQEQRVFHDPARPSAIVLPVVDA